jgi:hypothetical protein
LVMHQRIDVDNVAGLLQLVRLSHGISMAALWAKAYHAGCAGL